MGRDAELFRRLAKIATWITAIFGVALAVAAFIQGSWISASTPILGALAAGSAIVQLLCEKRANTLDEKLKRTPPAMSVHAVRFSPTLVKVAIVTENLVPFECQWFTCTADNLVVGAVPIDWIKIVPTKGRLTFVGKDHIHPERVKDGKLELHFQFQSVYAPEVAEKGLHGSLVVPVLELPPDEEPPPS